MNNDVENPYVADDLSASGSHPPDVQSDMPPGYQPGKSDWMTALFALYMIVVVIIAGVGLASFVTALWGTN